MIPLCTELPFTTKKNSRSLCLLQFDKKYLKLNKRNWSDTLKQKNVSNNLILADTPLASRDFVFEEASWDLKDSLKPSQELDLKIK